MGFIYKIVTPSGKGYIGQTIQPVDKRWKQHIDAASREYKDNCKVLNRAIRKYGSKHCVVTILEECKDEELDTKEQQYIQTHNTMVPHGMNIKFGGKTGKHNEISKKLISQSLLGRQVSNETRLKLSLTTNPNLPMYMIKTKHGYRVCNHPMGPEKKFISKTKSMDYNFQRGMDYLNKLNILTEPMIVYKVIKEVYIQKHKNGYCVKYPNTKPKYFVSKSKKAEELYSLALNYLNDLKSTSTVQRLNGNG